MMSLLRQLKTKNDIMNHLIQYNNVSNEVMCKLLFHCKIYQQKTNTPIFDFTILLAGADPTILSS